jgi:hypothetical protein
MTLASYNFKKGIDVPQFEWMAPPPFLSYHGHSFTYDGTRFIYAAVQVGTTATSASTTQLWRFDTWSNGWHLMATLTSGNRGIDIDYDDTRNCLWITHGAALTSWQVFNLSLSSQTLMGSSVAAYSLGTVAPVLPAAADYGASIISTTGVTPDSIFDTGTVTTGSTATTIYDSASNPSFGQLMTGLYMEMTSGALSGQRRIITATATDGISCTVATFGSAPSAGDTYKVVLPKETATAGAATTITCGTAAWIVNHYSNHDVEIIAGTGIGQRRRIASNTATVITLAAAVAGNARTGNWTVTPDATSQFVIRPSTDFLYYSPGATSATIYKMDQEATTKTWVTLTAMPGIPSSGGDMKYPRSFSPFHLFQVRGNATSNMYAYNIGLNSWITLAALAPETLTTGACNAMAHGKRRVICFKESAQRVLAYSVVTGVWEPAGTIPYAAGSAYDGKRAVFVKSPDGVEWIYCLRAGGQEFYRFPLEWL